MTWETIIWLAGDLTTAVVIFFFVRRKVFRTFPVFFAYLIWSVLSDGGLLVSRYSPTIYYNVYVITLVVDSFFQFGVLVELAWSILRPIQASLPRWSLPAIAALVAVVGAIVWPLAGGLSLSSLSAAGQLNVHVQETFSVLRILFFLLLAGCSQLLSIGWKDRELQIATGLGFYSLVSLLVWMQHRSGPQYRVLDLFVSSSYLCSLVYWAYCFAQQEAERREFTPQMQNFLLAMAGTARATRMALKDGDRRDGQDFRR